MKKVYCFNCVYILYDGCCLKSIKNKNSSDEKNFDLCKNKNKDEKCRDYLPFIEIFGNVDKKIVNKF